MFTYKVQTVLKGKFIKDNIRSILEDTLPIRLHYIINDLVSKVLEDKKLKNQRVLFEFEEQHDCVKVYISLVNKSFVASEIYKQYNKGKSAFDIGKWVELPITEDNLKEQLENVY